MGSNLLPAMDKEHRSYSQSNVLLKKRKPKSFNLGNYTSRKITLGVSILLRMLILRSQFKKKRWWTHFWACFNLNSQGTYLKVKVADLKVLGMLSRGHKDGGQEHLWSCRALSRKVFGEKQTK